MKQIQQITLALTLVATGCVLSVTLRGGRWERASEPLQIADVRAIAGTESFERRKLGSDNLMFDWTFGSLASPGGELAYMVLRSDRPSTLAVSWVLKLKRTLDPLGAWVEEREIDDQTIDIHWIEESVGRGTHFAARSEVLGCDPLHSLLRSQLLTAPSQLVHGTLPLTVYVVEGTTSQVEKADAQQLVSNWLVEAVRHHRAVCAS